ncbi:hypothetical protein JB92DRAFT_3144477 [Gautieria morchelliformis]|nr:hypothetical protein JB92DRAFT_3144477 [Gautieria morchelliformis]
MSTLSNSRSSSASSSSSQSSTPMPTTFTSSYSCLNNPARAVPASEATPTTLPPVPPSIPPPVTPVHPSFTLMTPTPPPSSSRPLPESPSDNKHSLNHNRNVKWRGSPLMAEITNVDDRCEEEATQLQSHSQSTPPQGQDHLDATSASSLTTTVSSSTPVPSASPSPSSPASAVAAACSTNTPNPLQTTNVYINGLPPHFKAEQLYALTSQFGTVLSCRTYTRQLAECPS